MLDEWDIGRAIVEKQQTLGWGESVVEMVSADLKRAFPGMSGFSSRNVWYMRRFYEAYTDSEFLAQAARDIERGERHSILPQAVADLAGRTKAGEVAIGRQAVAELPGKTKADNTEFLRQPVAEFGGGKKRPQPVAKLTEAKVIEFLPQLVAEIPWGHHRRGQGGDVA
jgi:hypothetical protein